MQKKAPRPGKSSGTKADRAGTISRNLSRSLARGGNYLIGIRPDTAVKLRAYPELKMPPVAAETGQLQGTRIENIWIFD